MRKNSHVKILKREPKEQHLSIVPKSCSFKKSIFQKYLLKKILGPINFAFLEFWR